MNNYDENTNVFSDMENTETKSLEIVEVKEGHDIDVEERMYGINKPRPIIIKAKISHDKD
ncbi:MAG: hypothetical protein HGJ94_18205 [Desulfosarcina sp.]|nr:hypothetical protein [Desulfosarcina sp.]